MKIIFLSYYYEMFGRAFANQFIFGFFKNANNQIDLDFNSKHLSENKLIEFELIDEQSKQLLKLYELKQISKLNKQYEKSEFAAYMEKNILDNHKVVNASLIVVLLASLI